MQTCNCDHDQLTIKFDPTLAKELSNAWGDSRDFGPINLRTASREHLLHLAAACLVAAGDYQDENGEGRFCWRLYFCSVDIVNKLVRFFFRGQDDYAGMDLSNVSVSGRADEGGWEG